METIFILALQIRYKLNPICYQKLTWNLKIEAIFSIGRYGNKWLYIKKNQLNHYNILVKNIIKLLNEQNLRFVCGRR